MKPLVSDLVKFSNFLQASQRRAKFWQQLYEKGQASSAVDLESMSASQSLTSSFETSYNLQVTGRVGVHTYRKKRGYVLWKTTHRFPTVESDAVDLMNRALGGLTLDMDNIWNVLPWTWLTDWFYDVSEVLEAHKGRFYVTPHEICLMTHTQTSRATTHYSGRGADLISPWQGFYETKERKQVSVPVAPEPRGLPILSGRQVAIGTSLIASMSGWRRFLNRYA